MPHGFLLYEFLALITIVFGLSMGITKMMIRVNVHALPIARSSHSSPIPSAGGVGFIIAFGFGFACLLVFSFTDPTLRLFYRPIAVYGMTGLVLAIVSFFDDWKSLCHTTRLGVHIFCSLMILASGFKIQFPGLGNVLPDWASYGITFVAIIALINGANFMDGLNGLLAGSVFFCLLFNSLLLLPAGLNIVYVNLLLLAALLGFLVFNFPKAKVFMGDVGSTFLGFTCAFLALLSQNYYPVSYTETALVHKAFVFTLTPLAFLWFDVAFTLLRRFLNGDNLAQAHRDHLIHILNDSGYSHPFVSGLYFLSAFIMGALTQLCHYGYLSFFMFIGIYAFLQITFVYWVFFQKKHKSVTLKHNNLCYEAHR